MSDQLTCPLCAQSGQFTLIPHLRDEHKIDPKTFQERFPEEKLAADSFAAFLSHRKVSRANGKLCYQLDVAGCPMTARFGAEHPLIPDPDPTFIWTDRFNPVYSPASSRNVVKACGYKAGD